MRFPITARQFTISGADTNKEIRNKYDMTRNRISNQTMTELTGASAEKETGAGSIQKEAWRSAAAMDAFCRDGSHVMSSN